METGSISTLSEHAHSADPEMRLLSLWALKHLVYQTMNPVKARCFDELGAGWLVQIIMGSIPISTPPTANSQHDNGDEQMVDVGSHADEQQDDFGSRAIALLKMFDASAQDIPDTTPVMLEHLQGVKAAEAQDRRSVAIEMELNIQRQGLDFIRNIMMGEKCEDMIDHVINNIGDKELFDILSKKIYAHAGWTGSAYGYKASSGTATPLHSHSPAPTYTSPQMLHSAVMTLTHIAAGAPRHRQLLVSQSDPILTPLLQLMTHPEPQIRVAVAFCIGNLTWVDDHSDEEGARLRAIELQRFGFGRKLEEGANDENVDVRERIATAREQMRRLLDMASAFELPGDLGLTSTTRAR